MDHRSSLLLQGFPYTSDAWIENKMKKFMAVF